MPDPVTIDDDSPDETHQALIVAVRKAIADLKQTIADAADTSSGVDDSYLLTDTLFDLLDSVMADNAALTDRVTALEAALADLQPTQPIGQLPPVPAP